MILNLLQSYNLFIKNTNSNKVFSLVGQKNKSPQSLAGFALNFVGVTRLAARQTTICLAYAFHASPLWLVQSLAQAAVATSFVFAPTASLVNNLACGAKTKACNFLQAFGLNFVGVTRFELATPRPPDVYSNRTNNADYLQVIYLLFLVVDFLVDFVPC